MKKTINILISLIFFFLIAQTSYASSTGAVLDSNTVNLLRSKTQVVGNTAGLGQASVGTIIATIIQAALGLLAVIFLILMIFAGFQWMTASGNEAQIKKSQDIIKTAIIGLVIVLSAYAITYFIFKYLPFSGSGAGGTGSNTTGGT